LSYEIIKSGKYFIPKMIIGAHFKKIVSASCRVDLVAFYPDYMVEKLEEIGTENVHTLVIWTKNPRNMMVHSKLNRVLEKLDQIYVLLTVTGLGGSPLEPRAPSADQVFQHLPAIIDFIGSPRRLAIRYDPLIDVLYQGNDRLSNLDINRFSDILSRVHSLGVERVIISYVTLYRKVIKRLKANNFEILEHPLEEITGFIQNQMIPQAAKLGMKLSTCVLPNLTQKGCIDANTLIGMHPLGIPCSQAKDKTQRGECHCTKSLDIGQWFSCYHGCLYCYGSPIKE
jgi:DNA repair photolyase